MSGASKQHQGNRARQWALGALLWSGAALSFPGDNLGDHKIPPPNRDEDVDKVIPYGSAQVERHSNIFALSGEDEALAQNGDDTLGDTLRRYIAGVQICLPLSNQRLRAILEGRRVEFSHFSHLDHDEYLAGLGVDLHLAENLDGTLDYQQERRMANFADRDSTDLALENERTATGSLTFALGPQWRIETGLRARELDSPQLNFPETMLEENTLAAELQYQVEELFTGGVYGEYVTGKFENAANTGKFHQTSLGVTADYSRSAYSSIGGQLGFTRREDEDSDDGELSELTGQILYHRELTEKTTLDLQAFRRVQSSIRDASAGLETGVGAEVAWKATEKILLAAAYQAVQGRFEDPANSTDSEREDESQVATLRMAYQVLWWLALRPYLGYEDRDSSVDSDSYRSRFAGVELKVRF